jgi:hypothetical protein
MRMRRSLRASTPGRPRGRYRPGAKLFARWAEALVERAVPLSLRITAEAGSALHRDIEAFDKYGTPFTAPAGTTDAELDLPGGLGGPVTGGSVRLEPAAGTGSAAKDIGLQIVDQADEVIAETLVHVEPPTTGPSRRGARAHGTEQHGAFTFEALTDLAAQTASYTICRSDLTGKPPGQLVPGLRLLREFRHPHGLRVARPFGPATYRPEPLPEAIGPDPGTGLVFDIVDALAVIQDDTTAQLRVPDLAELTQLRCPQLSGQGSNRILIGKGTGSSGGETEKIQSRVQGAGRQEGGR